jgi:hypothetical protein
VASTAVEGAVAAGCHHLWSRERLPPLLAATTNLGDGERSGDGITGGLGRRHD